MCQHYPKREIGSVIDVTFLSATLAKDLQWQVYNNLRNQITCKNKLLPENNSQTPSQQVRRENFPRGPVAKHNVLRKRWEGK